MKEITDRSWRWNELGRGTEFLVDDMESQAQIRLSMRGENEITALEATVEIEGGWRLMQRFHRDKGAWIAIGEPELNHPADPKRKPTERMRRQTIDRYLPQINDLLHDALMIDDRLHEAPRWREIIVGRWRVSEIRSRRGGKRELDPDEIEARVADGDTLPRIAADLGDYHQQSLANARHRAKRRSLDEPEQR